MDPIQFGLALHIGEVAYGNIGGANRLDFTNIGQPVNYAARLLAVASDLSLTRVASPTTSGHLCLPSRLAGEVMFKGFDGLQPVYAW